MYVLWGLILLVRVCDMLWTQLLTGFEFMWWPIFFLLSTSVVSDIHHLLFFCHS